jgi:hypothetical protein
MNDTINDPYRTAAAVVPDKAKFPRLIFEQIGPADARRLIQLSEEAFVVERREDHKDALGVKAVTWSQEVEISKRVNIVAFCLAQKLAEVLP